ncbi:MAG: DNA topoisomerase I, partial [Muribaculaceae bacterium]|nr:DNA topoisomerase I [Muribaculaceae bacterium]
PTYVSEHTIDGTPQEKRLYALIWKRTVASQMADAEMEKTTVDIQPDTRREHFVATGEVVKFDGFLRVYAESTDDENTDTPSAVLLPQLSEGMKVEAEEITATERFTQQPPRYTEASLVKKMEELGIGRPSTYAPTISTIQQREYVEKGEKEGTSRQYHTLTLRDGSITPQTRTETTGSDKGKLIPTDIGTVVNEFLTEYFPDILDYNFTARVEEKFDDIAEGQLGWSEEIGQFYDSFHPGIDKALNLKLEHKVGERILGKEPGSGKPVSVKIGRFGPLVQIGDSEGEEKPRFASLLKGQSMASITLEEALKLFEFPRNIGSFEDKDVTVAIGRFGPYVRHDGKFVSIPKDVEPASLSLEEAIELIVAKRESESRKVVKEFDAEPELKILNGRYGVYIAYKGGNYKIPKTVADPAALSLEQAMEIVKNQEDKPKRSSRRTTKK